MRFSPNFLFSQFRLIRRAAPASSRFYTVSTLNPNLSDSTQLNNLSNLSQASLLRVLNSTKDDPSLALSFLGQIKQQGVSLNVNAYATLVRILSSLGLDRKLDSVLVELIENEERGFSVIDLIEVIREEDNGSLLLIRVSGALVKAYVSLRMFDEAIDVLFQSKRFNCVPDIKACNFLMNRLIEFGKIDMVVALFRQLKQLELCGNEYTYAIVVKALCRKGDLEGAAMLVVESPSVFAYTSFLDGLCVNGETETAVALIKGMIDNKSLDGDSLRTSYGMVVRGFCKEKKMNAAERFILEMEEIGIGPDVYVYSAMIDRHCKNMNLTEALGCVDQMLGKGLKINCVIVSSILQCYCKMGMCLEALQKFKEFRDMNIFLDRVCYNVAFDAFSKLGRMEEAIVLLKEMRCNGMVPDVINYTTLLGGYFIQGKVADAQDLIDEIRENGITPDVILCNVIAGGLARNGHDRSALGFYNEMKKVGLKPNAVTHNVIIESLCFARKIKEAEEFFMSLEGKCIENYASLVKGYCESGLSKKAFKLFIRLEKPLHKSVYFKLFNSLCIEGYHEKALAVLKSMWAYHVVPGRSMCGKMIGVLCRLNNVGEAQMLFNTMVGRGLIPDLFTYTIMIHTYCRLNELQKADYLFEDMKQRGIKPDVVTYTVLLDSYPKLDPEHHETGYVKAELRKRNASEVWREFTAAGIELDVVCYTVLIDRQCKIHNLDNATKLFHRMIDNGLEPDMVAYTALICGYCRKGYIDKEVKLITELCKKDILPTEHFGAAVKRAALKAERFRYGE